MTNDDLQQQAREAVRPHVAKRAAAHEQVYGTAMTMTEEDACCADFRVGFLAAAEPREKELGELRTRLVQQAHDYRAQVVFWGENADQRTAEIATLRAKLEAVPVNALQAYFSAGEGQENRDDCVVIDRWLAGLKEGV